MKSLGFHHLALQVRDVDRVASFYRDVLGLVEVKRWSRDDGSLRSVWLAVDGSDAFAGFLAIEHLPGASPSSNGLGPSMIALRIGPDARAPVIAELSARGVQIEKQTGWTLYVRDPEGTLVGLSHHPFDAPP
ncbi:MAG: VOC family protein [Myxococcaceae bacterium]|nr:VOC family protein [Myxococcaceae bacterium]